ncbi:MAG: redoxin domain-containing protein [Saprospiraceae bacterium]
MALSKGDVAPVFTLNNTNNEPVSLTAHQGKPVVVLFFPLAFTGVCTEEMCTMRDNMAKYEAVDAQVLAISVDSPFTLAQFKEKENLNFPLLSDFNKSATKDYGVFYEDFFGMHGVSKRSAFVVDAEGKIAYAEVLESAGDQPNYHAIQETVRSLS